ncbi:MAG: hypothetical protein P4L69_12085 [Desulfosporosinus sp.]|nr:hypothetical protein [Desulfosporosinus sp.]
MTSRYLTRKAGMFFLLTVYFAVIAVRYAEPILDGDLFWHLAYAQQMFDHHTLVPNATLYSWTPVNGRMIYCAWLSELAFFGLWKMLGMIGVFALRYAIIIAITGLFWTIIHRARFTTCPAALLAILMLAVTAYPGSMQKPELFSLLFYHTTLSCYFRAKLASHASENPLPWLYAIPFIMLIWANAHGAHVLLAPFLIATAAGEVLNWRFSSKIGFSGRHLAHLLCAWALCAIAICLTPYGISYPLQNLHELSAWGKNRPDGIWNTSNLPIYSSGVLHPLSQAQVFAALAVLVIGMFIVIARQREVRARVDYALALSLIVFLPISVLIGRASYLWPALSCYSIVFLTFLAQQKHFPNGQPSLLSFSRWRIGQVFATLAFIFVSLCTGYDVYARPQAGSWLGFGIGYCNPVQESEYLAKANLGPRYYNTFDSGGYLLWRLYPQYQVMVDPRSFPYLDWFQDQYNFAYGTNFAEFLARYPADLAIIDLKKFYCWRNFIRANDWHILFYGPTAAIFARGLAFKDRRVEKAVELQNLRNAETAFSVYDFSVVVGDYETTWRILAQLETTLIWQADKTLLKRAQTYRSAHIALSHGDYDEANWLFSLVLRNGVVADRDQLILTLLRSRQRLLDQGNKEAAQTIASGLARLALPNVPEH